MELKVRLLDGAEEKGVAQVEQELLEKHENEINSIPKVDLSRISPQQDTQTSENNAPEEVHVEEEELDEQKVLSYIGKRYNKQINSFDDLVAERKEAEELPEDVASFLKYKKETGRGIDDFLKLKKDFDTMDTDQLLKEYLSATQEGLDSEDIDSLMDDFRYDDDVDEESKIKKIKIERKKTINEAKKFFNTQKEKYKLPLESSQAGLSNEEKQEYESYREYAKQAKTLNEENSRKRQWFDQKTDEVFSREFKGFEFNVNDKKLTFNPGESSE